MPAIGPQYLPMSAIAPWRCFTRTSGLACASTIPAPPPRTAAMLAATRVFFIRLSPRKAASAAPLETPLLTGLFPLAQPGRVFGYRPDLPVTHAGGHAPHHAVRVVSPSALLEGLQLGGDVIGVLAGETRILGRHPCAGGAMAPGAGRDPG